MTPTGTATGQPRLFVAVPIPADIKKAVAAAVLDLKQSGQLPFKRWVHPEDVHVTLKFIGEVAPSATAPIEAELERVAARSNPFPLRLTGTGTFGSPQAPRVLWAGLGGEPERLRALQADVERQLAALGYAPEERPFAPHLTLARQHAGGGPVRIEPLRERFGADSAAGAEWTVDRLVLYRSHFGRSPMYEPLRTVVFHAGG